MPDLSTPDTPPSLGGTPEAAALRNAAARYDELLAKSPTSDDPRYYTGVRDVIHGLRILANEADQADSGQPTPDRTAELAATLREVLTHFGPMHDQVDGPVTYYDGFAGVDPKTYDRWHAALDGVPGALDPTEADDPTPLRWGLHDVLWGDDDTVTVCLSGPTGEPYWLELGQDRADVLRADLAGPADAPATSRHEPVPCMRHDPHPAHQHSGIRKGVTVHGRCPGGDQEA